MQLGASADLDEAILICRSGLNLHPEGHSRRSLAFCQLANCLWSRYKRQNNLPDLEEAITFNRFTLEPSSLSDSDCAAALSVLKSSPVRS